MSKKALLGESRIRRFMELAGNSSHSNRFINETVEESEWPTNEEVEEGLDPYEEDLGAMGEEDLGLFEVDPEPEPEDPAAEEPVAMDDEGAGEADPEAAEAEAEEDVDVTVDEEQVAALRTAVEVLQSIIDASGGEEGEEDLEGEEFAMEPPEGEEGEEGEEFAMEPPGGEEGEAPEDEMVAESVEQLTKKVLERVTKRLVQQAIQR